MKGTGGSLDSGLDPGALDRYITGGFDDNEPVEPEQDEECPICGDTTSPEDMFNCPVCGDRICTACSTRGSDGDLFCSRQCRNEYE